MSVVASQHPHIAMQMFHCCSLITVHSISLLLTMGALFQTLLLESAFRRELYASGLVLQLRDLI